MTSNFRLYVMMIDKDHKKIVTISASSDNTDFVLPGGNLYPDESWTNGACRLVESQIGVNVRKKDLIFLHAGIVNKINTITFILYKWKGEMKIDFKGRLILQTTLELLRTIHYFKDQDDDYFKMIVDKYYQYRDDHQKCKNKCLIL